MQPDNYPPRTYTPPRLYRRPVVTEEPITVDDPRHVRGEIEKREDGETSPSLPA